MTGARGDLDEDPSGMPHRPRHPAYKAPIGRTAIDLPHGCRRRSRIDDEEQRDEERSDECASHGHPPLLRPLASMRRLCLPDRSRGGAETTSAQRQRFLCGSQAWIKAASLIDARPVYGRRVQFRVLGTFEVDAGGARSPSVGPIKHAVLANLLKTRESARYRPRRLRRTHAEDRLRGGSPCYMLVVDLPLRTMTGPRRLLHPQVSGRGRRRR